MLSQKITNALDIGGAGFIAAGIALIYVPAALVFIGLAALAISWKATR